ncbi:MAG: undecaprenyl-diphosphate phosphatase [Burkholderiales bacterium]|jgi:undecaprenyl-diphosphatase|nr:undecaprenyl-diphosphate phosphatase [Burkholderiales bacterium]
MDLSLLLKAVVLGLVEGLTEFLPISSTGHLIIAAQLLGFVGAKAQVFEIFIQLGAILAVCWEYRRRLVAAVVGIARERTQQRFVINLLIAFLPAAVLGLAFGKAVKATLFHPVPVAVAFVVGGVAILLIERRPRRPRVDDVDDLHWTDAMKLGFAQALALLPGTSRSGATIIGGLWFGLSRRAATEFSFFLAIPTLTAAALYDLLKHRDLLSAQDVPLFAVGFVTAFVSALIAVRGLLRFVASHDFTAFAWYRIVFGGLVLLTAFSGWVDWSAG